MRLCRSIARVCNLTVVDSYDDEQETDRKASTLSAGLKIDRTIMLGTVLAIELLWEKVGLKKTISDIARAKEIPASYERAFLAITANQQCAPESKLGVWQRWLTN